MGLGALKRLYDILGTEKFIEFTVRNSKVITGDAGKQYIESILIKTLPRKTSEFFNRAMTLEQTTSSSHPGRYFKPYEEGDENKDGFVRVIDHSKHDSFMNDGMTKGMTK